MLIDSHLVRGTQRDGYYSLGPKVENKIFNVNQTIKLTITKFLSPSLFFAYETTSNYTLDDQINLFYNSLNEFFCFENLPKVGTICAAKYSYDHKWYRAKVLSQYPQFKSVDLYFIDYGNIERHVHIKNIRKLESTFSTQFNSCLTTGKPHSQASLFGFVGVKPRGFDFNKEEFSKLNFLTFSESFSFQVVDLPSSHSNIKDKKLISIPLFLVRNDRFTKSDLMLSDCIMKELNWEECSINESLEVIIQSLYKIDYNTFNFHIMIPRSIRSLRRSKKNLITSVNNEFMENKYEENEYNDFNHSEGNRCNNFYESPENNDFKEYQENQCNTVYECIDNQHEGHDPDEHQENEHIQNDDNAIERDLSDLSQHSIKDLSDEENENIQHDKLKDSNFRDPLEEIDTREKKQDTDLSIDKFESDKLEGQIEENCINLCSVVNWKMTSVLVESCVKGLEWHIPLPSESVFRAIVTNIDDRLGFHINVCSEDIAKTFQSLEKSLLAHFLLCNNSMLRQFVSEIELVPGTMCLCTHNSTYNRGLIVEGHALSGKFTCKLIDYGYEIVCEKYDIIPISEQFCRLPPLAIKCILSGFGSNCENIALLVKKFEELLDKCEYEVFISLCYMDKQQSMKRLDDKVIISQPVPAEIFISQLDKEPKFKLISVNATLHEINQEKLETEELEPMSVSQHELFLSCSKTINDVESEHGSELLSDDFEGMKDIYITQTLHDQSEIPHPYEKKPVCEYYRMKGRCFKGTKCSDRHVMHSDCSDDEDDNEFKWIQLISYMNKSFERQLRIGSTIGMRVSSIYSAGVFYAYLTHGINGFDNEHTEICQSDDSDNDDNNGIDFSSIQDMEDSLSDYMKFKYASFDKNSELTPNTLVAVSMDDKICRASVTKLISPNRYQIFLMDYGLSYTVHLEKLFILPKEYFSKFKQQCFMCKLNGVNIDMETQSQLFAEWFFEKVNKHVLHAKVIDIDDDGMNYLELYDFITDVSSPSINSLVHKELNI